jgi:hypothetical protein
MKRISDIGVAKFLMTETIAPSPVAASPATSAWPSRVLLNAGIGVVGGVAIAAIPGWAVIALTPKPPPRPVRFAIMPPPVQALSLVQLGRRSQRNDFSPSSLHRPQNL